MEKDLFYKAFAGLEKVINCEKENHFVKDKEKQKEIAKERIKKLFEQAEKTKSQKLANRYVELARKIDMKVNLRMPKKFKRKFCKHCYNYFRDGNYRVRTRDNKLVYYCAKCKKYTRIPLS